MDITLFNDGESINLTLKSSMTDKQLVYFLDNTFETWERVVIW